MVGPYILKAEFLDLLAGEWLLYEAASSWSLATVIGLNMLFECSKEPFLGG